jgi:hypothetical protein
MKSAGYTTQTTIRLIQPWLVAGALLFAAGQLTSCFSGGKCATDDCADNGNAGGAGGGTGSGGGTGAALPCADKADAVRTAALDPALCPDFPTVEDFEKSAILPTKEPGCGGTVCHKVSTTKGFPANEPYIRTKDAFLEMAGVKNRGMGATNYCPNDAYIDLVDPEKSYLLAKFRQMKPDIACPSDGKVEPESQQMPSSGAKFDDVKLKCLEAYVIAVSEGCR